MALIEAQLKPVQQEVLNYTNPKPWSLKWILSFVPIGYICIWCGIYVYLIFVERAGLELASQQIWCLMSILQTISKLSNGLYQRSRLRSLFAWCERNYTIRYKQEYQNIIERVFEENNKYITWCLRWMHKELEIILPLCKLTLSPFQNQCLRDNDHRELLCSLSTLRRKPRHTHTPSPQRRVVLSIPIICDNLHWPGSSRLLRAALLQLLWLRVYSMRYANDLQV